MSVLSRRDFLGSATALTVAGTPTFAAMGPTTSSISSSRAAMCSIRARTCAASAISASAMVWSRRSRPTIPAARARAPARRVRQARDAGPRRSACPRLPVWLCDRHSADELVAAPVHDDLRVGRRCRRQQFRGVPPLHRGADAHAALCLHPYRQHGADAVPGRRALQHRFRAGGCLRQGDRRERRHRARRQGAHVGERDRQARHRTAQARHQWRARSPARTARSWCTSAASRRRN